MSCRLEPNHPYSGTWIYIKPWDVRVVQPALVLGPRLCLLPCPPLIAWPCPKVVRPWAYGKNNLVHGLLHLSTPRKGVCGCAQNFVLEKKQGVLIENWATSITYIPRTFPLCILWEVVACNHPREFWELRMPTNSITTKNKTTNSKKLPMYLSSIKPLTRKIMCSRSTWPRSQQFSNS